MKKGLIITAKIVTLLIGVLITLPILISIHFTDLVTKAAPVINVDNLLILSLSVVIVFTILSKYLYDRFKDWFFLAWHIISLAYSLIIILIYGLAHLLIYILEKYDLSTVWG